jgi:hypothetical protein
MEGKTMAVPQFNDPNNLSAGGTWVDDFGMEICKWTYYGCSRTVAVRCSGPAGKSVALPANTLSGPELTRRVVQVALDLAEQITGKTYND